MQKWEYLFVGTDYAKKQWKPRYSNGQELINWKNGPSIPDYSNQMGGQGWEMIVNELSFASDQFGKSHDITYRLVFKRLKP